ncbi:MAG: uroporphyrinogen-III synthase [Pyrinomonadaceae bacterium]
MTEEQTASSPTATNAPAKPLSGRTVMITRALAQVKEFASELERYGARIVACPTIEIVAPESYAGLDAAIADLYGYDWIIFTSANGVEYFLERLRTLGMDVNELDELRVCAVGEATGHRLGEAHIHVDVIPEKFQAEGVFAALESYVGGREHLAHLNFLIPRATVARDFLPHALEEAGARVDAVATYRTVRPESTDRARVEALLVGGAIDCITFTSSSTVINFAQLFDTGDLGELLRDVAIACIGEITTRTAADYGLRTHIRPVESTTPALARAIADYFSQEG